MKPVIVTMTPRGNIQVILEPQPGEKLIPLPELERLLYSLLSVPEAVQTDKVHPKRRGRPPKEVDMRLVIEMLEAGKGLPEIGEAVGLSAGSVRARICSWQPKDPDMQMVRTLLDRGVPLRRLARELGHHPRTLRIRTAEAGIDTSKEAQAARRAS